VTALLTLILTRPARPLIRRLPQPPLVGFNAHAAVGSQTSKPQRQSGISGGGLMAEELRGGPTSGSGSKFNQRLGICASTSSRRDCCLDRRRRRELASYHLESEIGGLHQIFFFSSFSALKRDKRKNRETLVGVWDANGQLYFEASESGGAGKKRRNLHV
jgi:hypothetical protein